MKTLYILTNSRNIIPQKIYERESLDTEVISEILNEQGIRTVVSTYDDFLLGERKDIESNYFFCASSQYPAYKSYISDILLHIKLSGGILIPGYQHYIAHDNKAFQELEKKRLNIATPRSHLVGTYEEGLEYLKNTELPVIAKTYRGFSSRGVKKIDSVSAGRRFLKANQAMKFTPGIEYFKWLFKKLRYPDRYPRFHGKVIFQEFLDGVEHDWKVLIFQDRCFVLKRHVKEGDFRASGSGDFESDEDPSENVLNFACDVGEKLDLPFASLDIIEKEGQCFLIEYQAVHFGLFTMLNASRYYVKDHANGNWTSERKEEKTEYYFARALLEYIDQQHAT